MKYTKLLKNRLVVIYRNNNFWRYCGNNLVGRYSIFFFFNYERSSFLDYYFVSCFSALDTNTHWQTQLMTKWKRIDWNVSLKTGVYIIFVQLKARFYGSKQRSQALIYCIREMGNGSDGNTSCNCLMKVSNYCCVHEVCSSNTANNPFSWSK